MSYLPFVGTVLMVETEKGGIDIGHAPLLGIDLRMNLDQTLVHVLDQKGMPHH